MTFKLMIRQTNLYDAADGFQLLLHMNEPNQTMFLWADASVAACKTKAAAIFKATLYWVGDVSTAADSGHQGTDLVWADSPMNAGALV